MTITTLPPGRSAGVASPSGPPTARAGAPPGFAAMLGDAAQTWTALAEGQTDNSGASEDSQAPTQTADLAVDATPAATAVVATPVVPTELAPPVPVAAVTPVVAGANVTGDGTVVVTTNPVAAAVIDPAIIGESAAGATPTSAASAAGQLTSALQTQPSTGAAVASAPVGEPMTTAAPNAAVVPVTTSPAPTVAPQASGAADAAAAETPAAATAALATPLPATPSTAATPTAAAATPGTPADVAQAAFDGAGTRSGAQAGGDAKPQDTKTVPAATATDAPAAPTAAAPATPAVATAAAAAPSVVTPTIAHTVSGATPAAQSAAIEALVHLSRQRGHSTARIALAPEQLGGIQVTLLFTSGGITARLIADRPEAAAALQRAGNDLRASLQEQGLDLTKLETGFAGDTGGRYGDRSESRWTPTNTAGNRSGSASLAAGDLDTTLHLTLDEPVAAEPLAPGRLIDLRA